MPYDCSASATLDQENSTIGELNTMLSAATGRPVSRARSSASWVAGHRNAGLSAMIAGSVTISIEPALRASSTSP